jgi:hypothetical protein
MYYGKINAGVVQDKQPPRRLTAGSPEPQTADPPAVDRHEYKKWMICFREQPTAEEDFYTRRLQDKLRISSLSFASDQPLRNPKPALKDFSSEQIPNPKT